MGVRIYLCGRVTLEGNGAMVDETRLPSRQGRLLFVMLAAEHHRLVSRDEIVEELWGATPPPAWDRALPALVSKLRVTLAGVGVDPDSLTYAYGSYQLRLPPDTWIDIEAAEQQLETAELLLRSGDGKGAYAPAHIAHYITERPFLIGEDGPWATATRHRLSELRLRALDATGHSCASVGEAALALRYAEQQVTLDPFRESAWRQLMTLHLANGSPAEALRAYGRCRRTLVEELGIGPSPQTEELYRQILGVEASE